jgi:DNA-binding transcriptional LysR family regulator
MKDILPSLDDLALFLAVAEGGGLTGAARATGATLPTLSRRMAALERALGRRLFDRGPKGYALTSDGRRLLAELEGLRDIRARLRRWAGPEASAPQVRITAGVWTSRYLARGIGDLWTDGAGWTPVFVASNAQVDIARREADIGIRSRRPDRPWLAGRRTGVIRYAFYARDPSVAGYVALPPEAAATTPSQRWLRDRHTAEIVTEASEMRLVLDLGIGGAGRVLLPCFAGDAEPGLQRVSPDIDDLTHEEWLVSHHEARHDPPVRKALDALNRLLGARDRT